MPKKLRIVLAQINPTVGDITGNLAKHIQAAEAARDQLSADVIVFPELSLMGYPPEDLLLRQSFLDAEQQALKQFMAQVNNIHCVISHTHMHAQGLYNACSLIYNDAILGRYAKQHLPNYGVFDEKRYFVPGSGPCVIPINGIPVGLVVCEDLWQSGPAQQSAAAGARILLSPNASPFEIDKHEKRLSTISKIAKEHRVAIAYVNNIGGQDDLVFDGGSMAVNDAGELCQFAGFFNEVLLPIDIEVSTSQTQIISAPVNLPPIEQTIYSALVLGVRDYIQKNNVPGVLIGVSGGIDSALTLAIAVDALGKDRVTAVMLPSRFTSDISVEDAMSLINHLGVKHESISIEPTYQVLLETLAPAFAGKKPDVTEENMQSRCRAIILMALSNKSGNMVLTTGNRSELATGYCTIYGDMAGGFCVPKDIPKTMVYQLANFRNTISKVIPDRTIERAPTAELAPDQKDEDNLPPYNTLDAILECYLNQQLGMEEIIAKGFDREVVTRVVKLVRMNEYKRRQAPLGPRINHTAFGKDRRYPVVNGFKA